MHHNQEQFTHFYNNNAQVIPHEHFANDENKIDQTLLNAYRFDKSLNI